MKKLIIHAIVLGTLIACKENGPEPLENPLEVPVEIKETLDRAGFSTEMGLEKAWMGGKEGYVVEFDIFISKDEVEALTLEEQKTGNSEGRSTHYRTSNIVTGLPRTINVFIDPGFDFNTIASLDAALSRYNSAGLALNFARVTSNGGTHIQVMPFQHPTRLGQLFILLEEIQVGSLT